MAYVIGDNCIATSFHLYLLHIKPGTGATVRLLQRETPPDHVTPKVLHFFLGWHSWTILHLVLLEPFSFLCVQSSKKLHTLLHTHTYYRYPTHSNSHSSKAMDRPQVSIPPVSNSYHIALQPHIYWPANARLRISLVYVSPLHPRSPTCLLESWYWHTIFSFCRPSALVSNPENFLWLKEPMLTWVKCM